MALGTVGRQDLEVLMTRKKDKAKQNTPAEARQASVLSHSVVPAPGPCAESLSRACSARPHGARQAPWSMGFSRPEHWSGLPGPPPGDLPGRTCVSTSLALQLGSLPVVPPGSPRKHQAARERLSQDVGPAPRGG